MEYNLWIDILLSFVEGNCNGAGVREAIDYKRNKKQKKEFLAQHSLLQNVFCLYSPKESHAPRHTLYYQIARVLNISTVVINIFLTLLGGSESVCRGIFLAKAALVWTPLLLETIYVRIRTPLYRVQTTDFSIFKKP